MKLSAKLILIVLITPLLNSCGVHKMNFDCQGGKGVGCQRVSRVNDLVNRDMLKSEINTANNKSKKPCSNCNNKNLLGEGPVTLSPISSLNQTQLTPGLNMPTASMPTASMTTAGRSKEKVMRIWFNGFYDSYNNFMSEQYVYTVIEPAHWISTSAVNASVVNTSVVGRPIVLGDGSK